MRVLMTSASRPLIGRLASALSANHQVRLTDTEEVQTANEFVLSSLSHDGATNDLVRGMDVIVHSGEADPAASESEQLDFHMRCTYNLLWAAWEERVPRLVYLSSLQLMEGYDEGLAVTERWRPVPSPEAPVLCYHMGEYVCREFAREFKIEVVCLRLGEVSIDEGSTPSTSALYLDDAIDAVEKAFTYEATGWDIFHIQSDVPNARFLSGQPWWSADEFPSTSLGYTPRQRGRGAR